jgi:hypothetical protein
MYQVLRRTGLRNAADAAGIPRGKPKNRRLKAWQNASDSEKEEFLRVNRQNNVTS